MEIKASRSTPTLSGVPQAVNAATGDHDGEIFLSWKPLANAKSYVIESSTDPSWEHAGVATSARKTISNLKSGTCFWFRVTTVGPEDKAAGVTGN